MQEWATLYTSGFRILSGASPSASVVWNTVSTLSKQANGRCDPMIACWCVFLPCAESWAPVGLLCESSHSWRNTHHRPIQPRCGPDGHTSERPCSALSCTFDEQWCESISNTVKRFLRNLSLGFAAVSHVEQDTFITLRYKEDSAHNKQRKCLKSKRRRGRGLKSSRWSIRLTWVRR